MQEGPSQYLLAMGYRCHFNNDYFIVRPLIMTHYPQTTNHAEPCLLVEEPYIHPEQSEGVPLPLCRVLDFGGFQHLKNIEDQIFHQAQQDYELLNSNEGVKVEGIQYCQINKSEELKEELQEIRSNAPVYQNWNSKKKQRYFRTLAKTYKHNLETQQIDQQQLKTSQNSMETHEMDQDSLVYKSSKKIVKPPKTRAHFKSHQKHSTPLFQLQKQQIKCQSVKKVSFFVESTVRYFNREDQVQAVGEERQYLFSTFDKF